MHRASHKTNYAHICILRAINRYCVVKSLRNIKYNRATVSMNGRVGCNCAYDRWIEYVNNIMKSRNISYCGFEGLIEFTANLKSLYHVDMQYSEVYGEALDTPITARGNYSNDIESLLRFFHEKIPDPSETTNMNPFQGLAGVDLTAGDYRVRKPWAFVLAIANGRSAPRGYNNCKTWQDHFNDYIKDNMYEY